LVLRRRLAVNYCLKGHCPKGQCPQANVLKDRLTSA
jgi:hypothetical protein